MVDVVAPLIRSRMMAGIRGKDTKPEILIRRYLHGKGFRFRLHVKTLNGKPDIVLRKWNAVIFVHGCFWHRHEGCRYKTNPATRAEFWQTKFDENTKRDRRNTDALEADGWRVAIVWECSLRGKDAESNNSDLACWLTSGDPSRFETPVYVESQEIPTKE